MTFNLLHPDLIREFVAEYQREFNRLRHGEQKAHALGLRELAKVGRETAETQVESAVPG